MGQCSPLPCQWLLCQCASLLVLLPLSVLSLNITGSITDGNTEVYTNRTWVVPLGAQGVLLSCDNDKGMWSFQNGSDVPGVGQGVGHAVHQVLTNDISGRASKDLVFTGRFSEGQQGFYQCTQPGGESAHVAVFLKGGLAPRNLRIVLESFPTARLMWDHPEVGVAAVTSYKITTVYPPGRPVKTVSKHSDWWRFDTRPDQDGVGNHQFELHVSAVYGQFLETIQTETVVLPPPTNLNGFPVLRRGAVQLHWTRVNAVISGYQVMFRKADSTPSNSAPFSSYHSLIRGNTSVVISNLAVGERYDFQVKAKLDRTDIAMQAFPSEIVVVETYSEPSAPLMVTVTPLSLSRVTVAWQPPSSLGGLSVLQYYLYVNDEAPLLLPSTNRSHTLTGLSPDATYIIAVAAKNALGVGSRSDPIPVIHQMPGPQSAIPLEVIIPVVAVAALVLVICVLSLLFYAAVHKRRDQFKQRLTQISHTLTRERGRGGVSQEAPPIPRPLPPPPANGMPPDPNPRTPHRTDSAGDPGAFDLHPATSFNVPRSCALQVQSDTMTTNATYIGDSQLNHAAAHPGRPQQPPPIPSRDMMLLYCTTSNGSGDETCTDEYEELDPKTLAELNPGYQKLRRQQCYEALRPPTATSNNSTASADEEMFSGTMDLNTESRAVPIEGLVDTQMAPHPQASRVGVAKEVQPHSPPQEGAQSIAAYSYEKPVATKKHKKRRRPPSQPPPPPPSATRPPSQPPPPPPSATRPAV